MMLSAPFSDLDSLNTTQIKMSYSAMTVPYHTATPSKYKKKSLREVYVNPGLQYKLSSAVYCPSIQNIAVDRRLARKSLPIIYGHVNNTPQYDPNEYYHLYEKQKKRDKNNKTIKTQLTSKTAQISNKRHPQ